MMCSECEKLIYLYKELDDHEKRQLDTHISSCVSCSALFAKVQKEQSVVDEIMKQVPGKFKNENPFLTSKVMTAIQRESEKRGISIIEQFLPVFGFRPLRYALAVVSLIIIVFFLVEIDPVSQTKNVVSFYKQMPIRETVRLNSSAFRERIKNSIRNPEAEAASSFSFAGCLNECRDEQKNNCEECISRYNKIKNNEGI